MDHQKTKQLADRLCKAREGAGLSIEDVGSLLASRYVGTEAMALKSGIEEIKSIELKRSAFPHLGTGGGKESTGR